MIVPELFADGFTWPEAPRWHDGSLWISDTRTFRLMRTAGGHAHPVCDVPGRPSGMGFLPDGRLLLATALDRKLLHVSEQGRMTPAADLAPLATAFLNDMVVDSNGRAWVGDTGFRFGTDDPQVPGRMIVYDEDAGARIATEGVMFPNGAVVAPDESTFYLSETFANRITAFDITEDGRLLNPRLHASLEGAPDGLCLDSEGALWVPLLFSGEFHRILPDGTIARRIRFEGCNAIACMLGGEDRRSLFLCVSRASGGSGLPVGAVHRLKVDVAGEGWP